MSLLTVKEAFIAVGKNRNDEMLFKIIASYSNSVKGSHFK